MLTLPRIIIGGGLLVVAAVAIAVAGWWFFVREDAKLATNAPDIPSDLATRTGTPGSARTGGAFSIIPEKSMASYFADEKLASLPLPSKAQGSTRAVEGTFYLTQEGTALDTSKQSMFTVDLTTLKSDRDMRDRRVQEQGLETSKYPKATFTVTGVSGYDPAQGDDQQAMKLTGMLDLHGVQKEVVWDLKVKRAGDVMTALATTKFKFEEFNIPVLNIAGFVSVQDTVTLQIEVVAQAA